MLWIVSTKLDNINIIILLIYITAGFISLVLTNEKISKTGSVAIIQ
jgi:hypothetical protein